MRLAGTFRLTAFAADHPDARSALSVWLREMEASNWSSPTTLKQWYPKASLMAADNVVFDIKGGKYFLHARINYSTGVALVVGIGARADRDKWSF